MEYVVLYNDAAQTDSASMLAASTFSSGAPVTPAPRLERHELEKADLRDIGRNPNVVGHAPVMPIKLIEPFAADPADEAAAVTASSSAWGIEAVKADSSSFDGRGVKVCVLDTGIDSDHPAFDGVTLHEMDFGGAGNGDTNGHGTHCAGTIFGRDVDGTRIGVATGVTDAFIGKVFGGPRGGQSETIFRAVQWAMDNQVHVVSMSLGFDYPGMVKRLVEVFGRPIDIATSQALFAYSANLRMFDQLMQMAKARAAFETMPVFVAASGNESRRAENPSFEVHTSIPAAATGMISVGALSQGDNGFTVAPFSNTNPLVSAPGVGVTSARAGGGLTAMNGTSMACPHVAGVAALCWQNVMSQPMPANAGMVSSRVMASARPNVFAAGVDVADRGAGMVTAPQ